MLSFVERNAHAILLASGLLLIFSLLMVGLYFNFFPRLFGLNEAVKEGIDVVIDLLITHASTIDGATKIIYALGFLVFGIISIVKGIRFAKKKLPTRLFEMLKEQSKILEVDRLKAQKVLLSAASNNIRHQKSSLYVAPLNRAFKELGLRRADKAYRQLSNVAEAAMADKRVANARIELLNEQIATSKLLMAVTHMASAEHSKEIITQREERAKAEHLLQEAIEHCPTDIDALEMCITLKKYRGDTDAAAQLLQELWKAAQQQASGDGVGRLRWNQGARAARELGIFKRQHFEQNGVRAALNRAEEIFEEGIQFLSSKMRSYGLTEDEYETLGNLYLALLHTYRDMGTPVNFQNAKIAALNALQGACSELNAAQRSTLEALQYP